jgi:hypothetical protein
MIYEDADWIEVAQDVLMVVLCVDICYQSLT